MPQPTYPLIVGEEIRAVTTQRASNLINRLAAALTGVALDVINEATTTPERQSWAESTLHNPVAAATHPRSLSVFLSNGAIQAAIAANVDDFLTQPSDNDIYFVATGIPSAVAGEPS